MSSDEQASRTRWPWVALPGVLLGLGAGAGMIVRDCALTCNVGYRLVPLAWIAIAALAVPFVALQLSLLRRVPFAAWQVGCPLLIAAGLVLFRAWTTWAVDAHEYAGADGQPPRAVQAAYLAYYVWIDPALVLLATNLVRLGSRVHAGRTEQGLAVLAPSLLAGGMAGGALAKVLVPALVEHGIKYEHARDGLLLVMALALCALAGVARAATGRFDAVAAGSATGEGHDLGVLAQARLVLSDRGVALTGLMLVLTGCAAVLVEYLFFWSVTEGVDGSSGRTDWFGLFYLVLNAATLVLLLCGKLVARLGLVVSLLVLPVAVAGGGAWALVAPTLTVACALRIARDGLTKSLFEPATERVMIRVSGARYDAVRTVLGGLGFSLGMGLGGIIAGSLGRALGDSRPAVVAALLAVTLSWVLVAIAAGRRASAVEVTSSAAGR